MSTNYYNTLIQIAEDSPTTTPVIPNITTQSVAEMQFRLLYERPYEFTSDDVIFDRVAEKNAIPVEDIPAARDSYFKTGRACLRTSPLAKTHGWGIHANAEGKVALIAADSDEYRRLSEDKSITKLRAMRTSRR